MLCNLITTVTGGRKNLRNAVSRAGTERGGPADVTARRHVCLPAAAIIIAHRGVCPWIFSTFLIRGGADNR